MNERGAVATIEALIVSVRAEGNAFAEGEEETLLVCITDDNGVTGIGECPCTPAVIKAMIDQQTVHFWSQGIRDLIVGEDPLEARALFDRVYHGSFYHGRRGTFIQAMSAVDIALWDLVSGGYLRGTVGADRRRDRSPGRDCS
jgi:L-alanine-DL-glutamate epimerase-like enolase superfamily enzyme